MREKKLSEENKDEFSLSSQKVVWSKTKKALKAGAAHHHHQCFFNKKQPQQQPKRVMFLPMRDYIRKGRGPEKGLFYNAIALFQGDNTVAKIKPNNFGPAEEVDDWENIKSVEWKRKKPKDFCQPSNQK